MLELSPTWYVLQSYCLTRLFVLFHEENLSHTFWRFLREPLNNMHYHLTSGYSYTASKTAKLTLPSLTDRQSRHEDISVLLLLGTSSLSFPSSWNPIGSFVMKHILSVLLLKHNVDIYIPTYHISDCPSEIPIPSQRLDVTVADACHSQNWTESSGPIWWKRGLLPVRDSLPPWRFLCKDDRCRSIPRSPLLPSHPPTPDWVQWPGMRGCGVLRCASSASGVRSGTRVMLALELRAKQLVLSWGAPEAGRLAWVNRLFWALKLIHHPLGVRFQANALADASVRN